MENTFLFSNDHLIMLLIFSVFLYLCPKLTKHLLPYSYIVEKVICILIILEITFEQFSYISMGSYDVYTCLPIRIYRFASYICIAILFFKNYQLFNIFLVLSIPLYFEVFSWFFTPFLHPEIRNIFIHLHQEINLIQTYKLFGYGEYQGKNQRKSQVDAKNAGRRSAKFVSGVLHGIQ